MLNAQVALAALAQHANASNKITAQQILALLTNNGVTFASILYVTPVPTAAAHAAQNIQKVVQANVQLFANIKDFNVYANAVKRSAANVEGNDADNVQNFVAQSNYFEHAHPQCFSLVQHKHSKDKLYLYAIFNNADSVHFINNKVATKQQVAQYLTPSSARKLLGNNTVVVNVANAVAHTVKVRTIALESIAQLTTNKQTLAVS